MPVVLLAESIRLVIITWTFLTENSRKARGLKIFKRFPAWDQIAPVYAVSVLVLYGWTLLWFLWKFSGWLYQLTIPEILVVLAYSLFTSFLESLIVTGLPALAAALLPGRWLKEGFAGKGIALIVPVLGYMIALAFQFQNKTDYPTDLLNWAPGIVALSVLLAWTVARVAILRRAVEWFGDRLTVFLYLSIPASLISLVVVAVRVVYFAVSGAG
jgi:hypothetical protein